MNMEIEFNDKNQIIKEPICDFEGKLSGYSQYKYDFNGNKIITERKTLDGILWEYIDFSYDDNKLKKSTAYQYMTDEAHKLYQIEVIEYNQFEKKQKVSTYVGDFDESPDIDFYMNPSEPMIKEYKYNEYGDLLVSKYTYSDGVLHSEVLYDKTEENITEEKYYYYSLTKPYFLETKEVINYLANKKTVTVYDENGNVKNISEEEISI